MLLVAAGGNGRATLDASELSEAKSQANASPPLPNAPSLSPVSVSGLTAGKWHVFRGQHSPNISRQAKPACFSSTWEIFIL